MQRGPDDALTLQYDTPDGPRRLKTRSVSLTIPAHAVANLLQPISSSASSALSSIDYPPVAAVAVSYPMSAIREDRKDAAGTLPGKVHTLPPPSPFTPWVLLAIAVFESKIWRTPWRGP